jgi:geranylgeranyl reductase
MSQQLAETFDVVVVGGGPAGSTAAWDLARSGYSVLLLDRAGRIKPCGGAIPPRCITDFDIPQHLLVAKVTAARMVSPTRREVDMPIDGGYVGMVDRETFDPWLRERAMAAGTCLRHGDYLSISRDTDGTALVNYEQADHDHAKTCHSVRARMVIGADGARSGVARQCIPDAERMRYVAAYHVIVESPPAARAGYEPARCDVYYQGQISPDFYGWVFPHGNTLSIGVGSARKGFSLRRATAALRQQAGLQDTALVRGEGAPLPMKPLRLWDNGRDVLLAGDAAGVVAPASGEGIYYAMLGGRLAADAVAAALATGDARQLRTARSRFMRDHGRVFWILGILQWFWYSSDRRRERFVTICKDPDVQRLTWQAYMHKRLVRGNPLAQVKIFFKDVAHLLGVVRA